LKDLKKIIPLSSYMFKKVNSLSNPFLESEFWKHRDKEVTLAPESSDVHC
jgi:hypothetical protein